MSSSNVRLRSKGTTPAVSYPSDPDLPARKRRKYKRRIWTKAELALLRRLYPDLPTKEIAKRLGRAITTVYGQAHKLGLRKTKEFLASPLSGWIYKGDPRQLGKTFRFQKGHAPANKGLRRPGYAPGRMKETQFRKGQRSGFAARNWKPIGTILPDSDGYLRIKVREAVAGEEATGWGNPDVWPQLHHEVWEQFRGPIPPGHAIAFKDGNRKNCAIENLECISRAELARRNRMWNTYPRELAEVMQLAGALKRKIRRKEEGNGKK
jgi:HNH endonuclease